MVFFWHRAGPCVQCSLEDYEQDENGCKLTGHHRPIVCFNTDEENGGDGENSTFTSHESCREGEVDFGTGMGMGYFEGMMFLVLAISAPVVVVRRNRSK